jgi:hypothetical protein
MHSGRDAPTMRAIVSLDSSSAFFASRPAAWIEDALPHFPLREVSMASRTSGASGEVELLSKYIFFGIPASALAMFVSFSSIIAQ